jgi:hypothetical protein
MAQRNHHIRAEETNYKHLLQLEHFPSRYELPFYYIFYNTECLAEKCINSADTRDDLPGQSFMSDWYRCMRVANQGLDSCAAALCQTNRKWFSVWI